MRNGRESLLLNELAGWRAASLTATLELAESRLRLRRQPGSLRPLVDAGGSFGGLTYPSGLAVDADGRIYVIDGRTIKRFDPCTGKFTTLPCVLLDKPRGIAISPSDDLFVTDGDRVLVYLLPSLKLLRVITRRKWEPWDVAVTLDCRVFISDYAGGVVWRVRRHDLVPVVEALVKPTAIAVDAQCNLYVIQEGKKEVVVFDEKGKLVRTITVADEAKDAFCPTGIAVDANGNVCIADLADRTVYTTASGCDEARPVRAVDAAPGGLAFDARGNPIVAEADRKRICTLEAKAAYETEGTFVSEALDSRIYRCQWHRVRLHRALPAGAQIYVETFSSESLKTDEEIAGLPDSRWLTREYDAQVSEGEWDCLVQSPPGRYLWLRLTLIGNGGVTPEIGKVRVHFPRASSMQYLPAVFGENAVARDFVARFLSIFDTIRDGISDNVRDAAAYFDPEATPAGFLDWLASWIGLALERNWPVAKRRMLVRDAHKLYEKRGTPEGLRMHIRLFAGREPLLLEHFQLRRWMFLNRGRLGDCSALFGASIVRRLQLDRFSRIGEFQLVDSGDPLRDPFLVHAHQFSVMVPLRRGADAESERRALERIIEASKPAHTKAELHLIEPRLRIGTQAFIGIDTVVGEYPSGVTTGKGNLGRDTVLGPPTDESRPPAMRIGARSRIGVSTSLR
ncbi:MAG TPA: phage tail protein [Thermoanaerobaculia bacterium]|nr:phage tail protein [Thermoanaerobaculia bacterium]